MPSLGRTPRTEATAFQVTNFFANSALVTLYPLAGAGPILVCNAPYTHSASKSVDDRAWLTMDCQ